MCRMCDQEIQKPGDKCAFCGKIFARKTQKDVAPEKLKVPLKEVAEKKTAKHK